MQQPTLAPAPHPLQSPSAQVFLPFLPFRSSISPAIPPYLTLLFHPLNLLHAYHTHSRLSSPLSSPSPYLIPTPEGAQQLTLVAHAGSSEYCRAELVPSSLPNQFYHYRLLPQRVHIIPQILEFFLFLFFNLPSLFHEQIVVARWLTTNQISSTRATALRAHLLPHIHSPQQQQQVQQQQQNVTSPDSKPTDSASPDLNIDPAISGVGAPGGVSSVPQSPGLTTMAIQGMSPGSQAAMDQHSGAEETQAEGSSAGRGRGGKRELSTSKRAAQNRAAQVCLPIPGEKKRVRREGGSDGMNDCRELSVNAKKATSKS